MKYHGRLLNGVMCACTPTLRFQKGVLKTLNDDKTRINPEDIRRLAQRLNYPSTIEPEKV